MRGRGRMKESMRRKEEGDQGGGLHWGHGGGAQVTAMQGAGIMVEWRQ